MKLFITPLLIAAIGIYLYYKHASVQDEVDTPIDYESTQAYKDNEPWFSGMGRS